MRPALIVVGIILVVASFAVYQNLLGYGCAMQMTGCNGFSVDYFSSEAAFIFWPIFLFGVGLIGLAFKLRK